MNYNKMWEELKGLVSEETLTTMIELEKIEKNKLKKEVKKVEVKIKDMSNEELKINNKVVQDRYERVKHKLKDEDKMEIQKLLGLYSELNAIEGIAQRREYLNGMTKKELIKYCGSESIGNKSKSCIVEIILDRKNFNDRTISMIIASV